MIPPPLSTTEPRIYGYPRENQRAPFPLTSEMIQYDYSAVQWIPIQECKQIKRDEEHLSGVIEE